MIILQVKLPLPNGYSAEILFSLGGHQTPCLLSLRMKKWFVTLCHPVNISKATGYEGISNKIKRLCSEGLYKPFTSLINTSFRLGQYPSAWKLANVLPLFKKDDRQLTINYLPVSLLPSLSKICEKVAFFYLFNFLNMTCFFYKFQSGFRPWDSTLMQLVNIVHEIYEALEEGSEMRTVFLDISKAFDRVWHCCLIVKLRSIGVERTLFNWLLSYLSCHKQRVIIKECILIGVIARLVSPRDRS